MRGCGSRWSRITTDTSVRMRKRVTESKSRSTWEPDTSVTVQPAPTFQLKSQACGCNLAVNTKRFWILCFWILPEMKPLLSPSLFLPACSNTLEAAGCVCAGGRQRRREAQARNVPALTRQCTDAGFTSRMMPRASGLELCVCICV